MFPVKDTTVQFMSYVYYVTVPGSRVLMSTSLSTKSGRVGILSWYEVWQERTVMKGMGNTIARWFEKTISDTTYFRTFGTWYLLGLAPPSFVSCTTSIFVGYYIPSCETTRKGVFSLRHLFHHTPASPPRARGPLLPGRQAAHAEARWGSSHVVPHPRARQKRGVGGVTQAWFCQFLGRRSRRSRSFGARSASAPAAATSSTRSAITSMPARSTQAAAKQPTRPSSTPSRTSAGRLGSPRSGTTFSRSAVTE